MMFLQPDHDWVENHRQKKNQREQQNHRLQRTQNQPRDNQQKGQPNNAPGAVIAQWCVLIFMVRFFHTNILFTEGNEEKKDLNEIGLIFFVVFVFFYESSLGASYAIYSVRVSSKLARPFPTGGLDRLAWPLFFGKGEEESEEL